MHIDFPERLRPYSHLAGTYFNLPLTFIRLQFFPAVIHIYSVEGAPNHLGTVSLPIQGPVDDFTVQQDLEKGCIRVRGNIPEGFFSYRIVPLYGLEGFSLTVEKAPEKAAAISLKGAWRFAEASLFTAGNRIVIGPKPLATSVDTPVKLPAQRLTLGNSKAQDWELIRRRQDFTEIFPLWYRLGHLVFEMPQIFTGTVSLLKDCERAIQINKPEHILAAFRRVFLAGFDLGLSPRLVDTDFNGILEAGDVGNVSPLLLLTYGARLIRSLFIKEAFQVITLLPMLPQEFHCGRLIDVVYGGKVELEWTKKAVRRVIFHATENQQLSFVFSRGETACRLRTSNKDRGTKYSTGDMIDVVAGQDYWLDNFVR